MQQPDTHNKKQPRWIVGSVIAATFVFLTAAAVLSINNGVLAAVAAFIQAASPGDAAVSSSLGEISEDSTPSDSSGTDGQPTVAEPVFARPDQMKGVWLVAGTDYYTQPNQTGETVKKQIDAAFEKLTAWDLNTVIVPVSVGGNSLFTSSQYSGNWVIRNSDASEFDAPAYIRECAAARGLYTYGVLDLRMREKNGPDPSTAEGARAINAMVSEAVSRFTVDGWLIANVGYAAGDSGSYEAYSQAMPGSGFEYFLRQSVTAAVTQAVKAIHAANANAYVGLLADAVWAHATADKRGSQTQNVYEAYSDGFADTRAWVESGLLDFVMVDDAYATTNASAAFGTVLNWWTSLCGQSGTPLYVSHAAKKAGGSESGWRSPDQLAQQVLACKSNGVWKGSVFDSYTAFLNDVGGSTKAVLGAFGNTLNEEYISRTLEFTSPTKTSLTTYESTINIRGSADPNFPLTMNGKEVSLSAHGFFSIDLNLNVGTNKYTFVHKGKTVVYTITHRVVVIQSVAPSSTLSLEGGTTISISTIAYKGASVYAKLGNTTIKMKESALQTEENSGGDGSDYINYAGQYTLPEGIVGKAQNLGTVVVYGTYKNLSESKKGGAVVVNAKPVPPPTTTTTTTNTGGSSTNPIDPGSGSTVLKTGKILMVSKDYAETFSGNTTDDWSRPVNAYLPKGTMDVFVSSVYDSSSKNYYYLLGSGRRVYQSDATVYKTNGTLTANTLTLKSVTADASATVIQLGARWRIPYNVRLLPQGYVNEAAQDYRITAFTATYVDITFYYTTQVPATPDVSSSSLFKSASWVKGSDNSYILRLNLRSTGAFYGYSAQWDNSGNLTLRFNNPSGVADGSKPLTGKRIVVDPGHGGNSIGTAGGTASEKAEVLKYGLLLRNKLEALGATVIMTRTTDTNPDYALSPASMAARTNHARNGNADLFISIHMDGAGSTARGPTVFYFNEYSQPFAKSVTARVAEVYKKVAPGVTPRGYKWAPFFVTRLHDCPALLIECGFMTNASDLELLISDAYRESFTQAMADGIVDYCKSLSTVSGTVAQSNASSSASAVTTTLVAPAGLLSMAGGRKRRRCQNEILG